MTVHIPRIRFVVTVRFCSRGSFSAPVSRIVKARSPERAISKFARVERKHFTIVSVVEVPS